MFDVWLVLGVNLILVSVIVWGVMTQPAAVGYFFCGGLAVANVALAYPSLNWLSGEKVPLLWVLAYIASMVGTIGAILVVSGKVYRAYKVHLDRIRLGPDARPPIIELDLATKGIVLGAAGIGTVVVIYLILSRQMFFLQPGEMWQFYLWLGASAFVSAAVWYGRFHKRATQAKMRRSQLILQDPTGGSAVGVSPLCAPQILEKRRRLARGAFRSETG